MVHLIVSINTTTKVYVSKVCSVAVFTFAVVKFMQALLKEDYVTLHEFRFYFQVIS